MSSVGQGQGWRREITHCPYGHPYDEENTYWGKQTRDGGPMRQCRACRRRRRREYKAREELKRWQRKKPRIKKHDDTLRSAVSAARYRPSSAFVRLDLH